MPKTPGDGAPRAGGALLVAGALLAVALGALAVEVGTGERPRAATGAIPVERVEPRLRESTGKGAAGGPAHTRPNQEPAKLPSAAGLRRASQFAQARGGAVSFAVVNTEGNLRGRTMNRLYSAASLVKAMLLAAEVRRLTGRRIDEETEALLGAMVTGSDNDAADAIYARCGDAGLNAVAERAGMTRYTVAGHWGNSQVAAGDMALFFAGLDDAFPKRHAAYAKGLLGSVVPEQSWGIPEAAGENWAVRFKGGWLPEKALVNQAAELRERDGRRRLSIAVLTDGQASHEYGVATVRGVAERLLER